MSTEPNVAALIAVTRRMPELMMLGKIPYILKMWELSLWNRAAHSWFPFILSSIGFPASGILSVQNKGFKSSDFVTDSL